MECPAPLLETGALEHFPRAQGYRQPLEPQPSMSRCSLVPSLASPGPSRGQGCFPALLPSPSPTTHRSLKKRLRPKATSFSTASSTKTVVNM